MVCVMACVSACGEMAHGPIQTGDGNGKLDRLHGVVLGTAPAPRDAACEVRSVFCEWSKRTRLRDWKPALKHVMRGAKTARAWLKGRLCEYESTGPHASACAGNHVLHATWSVRRMCGASPRDDTFERACTASRAGSMCE